MSYTRYGTMESRRPETPSAGSKFGHWTVTSALSTPSRVDVVCVCGVCRTVRVQDLRSGRSASCGCRGKGYKPHTAGADSRTSHGYDYGSKLYRTWRNVKNRVSNKRSEKYQSYGAVGIRMHQAWFDSFEAFKDAVGEPPSSLHSLDRKDPNKGYEPGNVRWATSQMQNTNRKCVVPVTVAGEVISLKEACRLMGVPRTSASRALKAGMTFEEFLEKRHATSSK